MLENSLWRVDIDPATLALRVTPAGKASVQASSGMPAHTVSDVQGNAEQASWQWDGGAYRLVARLEQRDLTCLCPRCARVQSQLPPAPAASLT